MSFNQHIFTLYRRGLGCQVAYKVIDFKFFTINLTLQMWKVTLIPWSNKVPRVLSGVLKWNIGMFILVVSSLYIKSNIFKGNLTEIMPGTNYLSKMLHTNFFFGQARKILLNLHFSHAQFKNILWPLDVIEKYKWIFY